MSTDAWDMVPLALVAQVTLGKMVQNSASELETVEQPYLHAANVRDFGVLDTDHSHRTMWFSPGEVDSLKVKSGDVVVVEGGAVGKSAYVKNDLPGYGFQNSILRVRAKKRVSDGRFIQYSLQSAYDSGEISRQCSSVSLAHFPAEKINRFRVPYPSLETQQRIADYLDRETAEIDAAVADLDKYVELLEKRRRVIIVDGFNDPVYNPVMQRLKFLTISEDHRRIPIKSGDRVDMAGKYPYYGASGIIDYVNDYLWDGEKRLILSEDGANLVMRNHPVAFVADGQYWVNNHAHVLRCADGIPPELVAMAIEVTSIAHLITGSAQPKLTAAAMGEVEFMFPLSTADQRALLEALRPEMHEIDSLIADSTKLRDLLLKRRSVLITEVVTGRKQV